MIGTTNLLRKVSPGKFSIFLRCIVVELRRRRTPPYSRAPAQSSLSFTLQLLLTLWSLLGSPGTRGIFHARTFLSPRYSSSIPSPKPVPSTGPCPLPPLQTDFLGKQSRARGGPCAFSPSPRAPSAGIPCLQFHISPQAGGTSLWTRYRCDCPELVAHRPTVVSVLTPVKVGRSLVNHYAGCSHALHWFDLTARRTCH